MHPRVAHLIEQLALEPHPEGGHYQRFHVSDAMVQVRGRTRPALTAINFLLAASEVSRWHRVDADECWDWQEGDMLELLQFDSSSACLSRVRLGLTGEGARTKAIVPAGTWAGGQAAGCLRIGLLHGFARVRVAGIRTAG